MPKAFPVSSRIFFDQCVELFEGLGVQPGDAIMVHSDAVILGPGRNDIDDKIESFWGALKSIVGNSGTVLVPSFSMSWTKGEAYNVKNSPCTTGMMAKNFGASDGVLRTQDPIYNFYVWGRHQEEFVGLNANSCFGEGSLFERFYKLGGGIVCAGCSLDRATFVHFVEEARGVSYRYYKTFHGETIAPDDSVISGSIKLYVRNLDLDTFPDHGALKDALMAENILFTKSLGRISCIMVRTHDFYNTSMSLLNNDIYALIRERKKT